MVDFFYVTIKVGDKTIAQAKHLGIKDGMVVDYIDPDEWGLPDFNFGSQHKKAFAVLKLDKIYLPLIKEKMGLQEDD